MNAVGKAGSFIIKYQIQIELILVLILIAAAVFFLVRAIINAGKKRQILSQINDTVTEINTAVTSLSEKKSDVIYIDNRTSGTEEGQGCTAESRVSSALENADLADGVLLNASQASAELSDSGGAALENAERQTIPECPQKNAEPSEDSQQGDGAKAAAEISAETEPLAAEEKAEEQAEEKEIPKKYFSRDCGISRNGRTYTAEELEKQIKE